MGLSILCIFLVRPYHLVVFLYAELVQHYAMPLVLLQALTYFSDQKSYSSLVPVDQNLRATAVRYTGTKTRL